MKRSDKRDRPDEEKQRPGVAEAVPLGDQVAGRGAKSEREENDEPVERLPPSAVDRVNRERPLAQPPREERDREQPAEERRLHRQRHAVVVVQVVGDLGADDADQHDPRPIDPRDVTPQTELEEQRDEQKRGRDVGRLRESEPDVVGEIVRRRLTHRRTENFDHPEVEGDLGNLVQHLAQAEATLARRRHRLTLPATT